MNQTRLFVCRGKFISWLHFWVHICVKSWRKWIWLVWAALHFRFMSWYESFCKHKRIYKRLLFRHQKVDDGEAELFGWRWPGTWGRRWTRGGWAWRREQWQQQWKWRWSRHIQVWFAFKIFFLTKRLASMIGRKLAEAFNLSGFVFQGFFQIVYWQCYFFNDF